MPDQESVINIVQEKIRETEIFLVDVTISPTRRITVEIDRDQGLPVSDCAMVNRHLRDALGDAADEFEIQVTSPGIDKPFKVTRQYHKNVGRVLSVSLNSGEKQEGKLIAAGEESITLHKSEKVKQGKKKVLVEETLEIPYADISEAKLVIKF